MSVVQQNTSSELLQREGNIFYITFYKGPTPSKRTVKSTLELQQMKVVVDLLLARNVQSNFKTSLIEFLVFARASMEYAWLVEGKVLFTNFFDICYK